MLKTKEEYITVRIKASTWKRLKVRAAKEHKFIWEMMDELSKTPITPHQLK